MLTIVLEDSKVSIMSWSFNKDLCYLRCKACVEWDGDAGPSNNKLEQEEKKMAFSMGSLQFLCLNRKQMFLGQRVFTEDGDLTVMEIHHALFQHAQSVLEFGE